MASQSDLYGAQLPLFRDQLALTFVRLRLRTYLIGPPLFTATNINLKYFLKNITCKDFVLNLLNVMTQ